MQLDRIESGDSSIDYYYSLNGNIPLICFHGYGEDAGSFLFLEKALPPGYSLFAINLPFHGQTSWDEKETFNAARLAAILRLMLDKHFIPLYPDHQPLVLAGYSLGGRVVLSLYEQIAGDVQKLVLLAPDGLKMNPWYWFATQTYIGNRLFALTMKKPGWFFWLLKAMQKTGLVNASIFKFVKYYIGDPVVRQQLYSRWTTLRHFRPDLKKTKTLIQRHQTNIKLIYGIHDRIILSSVGKKFVRGIEPNCQLIEIHAGHQVLHEKHMKEILPAFLQ